ncbi:MAG: hypothetical protein K0Q49_2278, partial [Haloplasmataceae bacterium]|nr:hypothetical protein [Haloplasmataceae bacterium]
MNKLFDKIKFIIRLSFKNIIYSKFRAIILLMTFTILIFLSILTFSTKTFLTQYFYREKIETYQDIDFYLTYDQNSNARYFSIRELANKMDIEKEFKYIVPFFQMNSIMEINNNTLNYVNILATSLEDFKKVTNISNSYTQLNQNEILITSTIGKKYTILTGDTIYLKLGGEEVPFKVIDVIDDNGLFRDNNVFIDKDSNIKYFLKSFGMEDLNPIFTKNIYNRVYFSLNDDSKKEEIKKEILDIPQYKNYLLIDTINNELIEESVTKVASILFLVFTFILLSVVLVLQSTLLIIFEERKPQIGVTQILG